MNITHLEIRSWFYQYKGTHWILAYAPERDKFVAFNYKFIKSMNHGILTLTQQLTDAQMHPSPNIIALLKNIKLDVDFDEWSNLGLTTAQAICMIFGFEYSPELETLLS